jgi:hypothetical protein
MTDYKKIVYLDGQPCHLGCVKLYPCIRCGRKAARGVAVMFRHKESFHVVP